MSAIEQFVSKQFGSEHYIPFYSKIQVIYVKFTVLSQLGIVILFCGSPKINFPDGILS